MGKINFEKQIKKLPLADAKTPRDGEVITNRWWVVDDEGLYWYSVTPVARHGWRPQCNTNEKIAQDIQAKLYPDARIEFIPLVFCGHYDDERGFHPFPKSK